MSYHGKLQVLKNGTADAEIQLWAYHQLEKELTLTDEEIQELAMCDEFWISEDCTIFDWHKFARAILRKAQEK